MEKEFYQFLFIEIIEWEAEDVFTASISASEEGDDLGDWNSSWFAKN